MAVDYTFQNGVNIEPAAAGQVNPSSSAAPLGLVVREVNVPMGAELAYTNVVPAGDEICGEADEYIKELKAIRK